MKNTKPVAKKPVAKQGKPEYYSGAPKKASPISKAPVKKLAKAAPEESGLSKIMDAISPNFSKIRKLGK